MEIDSSVSTRKSLWHAIKCLTDDIWVEWPNYKLVPFHHVLLRSLSPAENDLLWSAGIQINSYSHFSEFEDSRIYKNWRRLSQKYDLDYVNPLLYFTLSDSARNKETKDSWIPFWPMMCKGLMNRTAKQVYSRARKLFDPANWDSEKGRIYQKSLADSDMAEIKNQLAAHGGDYRKVAENMGQSVSALYSFYFNHKLRAYHVGPIKIEQYKLLWSHIAKRSPGEDLYDLVEQYIVLEARIPDNWKLIAKKMRSSKSVCKEAWENLKRKVKKKIKHGETYDAALRIAVFDKAVKMKLYELGEYISIILSEMKITKDYTFHKQYISDQIEMKCVEAGISNFYTPPGVNSSDYLRRKLLACLNQLKHLLWNKLTIRYTEKDLLRVIRRVCRMCASTRIMPTNLAVTESVRYILKRIDPKFIVPPQLRKYIFDEELLEKLPTDEINKKYKTFVSDTICQSDISDAEN